MHTLLGIISFSDTVVSLVVLAVIIVFGARIILKLLPNSPESTFILDVVAFFKKIGLVIETDAAKIEAAVKAELVKIGLEKAPVAPVVTPAPATPVVVPASIPSAAPKA
jgi:hypothetical protein